jgi:hypothetical protein
MHAPCPIWHALQAGGLRSLAVMGMTKNTGKTVTLNHLLRLAHTQHRVVGLSSIGRDGEERDQVYQFEKPPVQVHAGCLVATAKDTLPRAQARLKLLGGTGVTSPMGEVVIVKVTEPGDMEVAGPSRGVEQIRVMDLLRQCGADLVLLDGALGRGHHASPSVAEGVVLATGAALGGGMGDVIKKTAERLTLLTLPGVDAGWHGRLQPTMQSGGVSLWNEAGECLWHDAIATLNADAVLSDRLQAHPASVVAVSGAVGRRLWQAVMQAATTRAALRLVVQDGTRLFVDASAIAALKRLGGDVVAWRGIRMLGLTLNPFSPFGGSFEAAAFLRTARQHWPQWAVTDVMCPPVQEDA